MLSCFQFQKHIAYLLGFHQQTCLHFLISHTQLQVFISFALKSQFGSFSFNIIHQNGESITFGGSAPKVLRDINLSLKQLHYMKHIVDHRYCTIHWNYPHPVTVTTRMIPFLVGNPYKPSLVTITRWGGRPKLYIYEFLACKAHLRATYTSLTCPDSLMVPSKKILLK